MRFDDLGFVEVLGIGEDAGGHYEPAFEGPAEVHDIEDVVFYKLSLVAISSYGASYPFGTPAGYV